MNTLSKSDKAKKLIEWIDQKSSEISYGVISLQLTIHDCKIRQIEKTVTEKIREEGGN